MLSAIYFYNYSFIEADEVYNIIFNWLLPSKFASLYLLKPQMSP